MINPLPVLVTVFGTYFLFKLRFFPFLYPGRILSLAKDGLKRKGALSSLMLALAGTLGVGNVFGVSIGIILGGAGSVFWLLVSTLFASVLKYCEVVLCADTPKDEGDTPSGMLTAVKAAYKNKKRSVGAVYALCTLLLSLVMGAALQSGSAAECAHFSLGISEYTFGIIFVLLVALAVKGGGRIISKLTGILIPVSTIVYVFLTLFIIIKNADGILDCLYMIVSDAFSPESFVGGIFGFVSSRAVREGYCRGILSNEAGAGTSSAAHARCTDRPAAEAGIMGVIEVFFDTAVLCVLTALAILLAVPDPSEYTEGMELVLSAVRSGIGSAFCYPLLFCVLIFAFSTVICWYYYGSLAISELVGKRAERFFFPVYLLFVFVGSFVGNRTLIFVTDFLMLVLSLITLCTLTKSSDRIRLLSEQGGLIPQRKRM